VPRTVNNPDPLGFARPRVSGHAAAVGQNSEEILRELGQQATSRDRGAQEEPGRWG
jgi:hypothetical protein